LAGPATGQEAAGARAPKLEFDDIQYILLARVPAITGRYEFLSFREPAQGRVWLTRVLERVASVQQALTAVEQEKSWVTVAFTYNGLRALGVSEDSLATFPEEFRQGMVARNEVIGDIGVNHPDNWVGGLASPDLHAVAIVFARDRSERDRMVEAHHKLLQGLPGVEVLSWLDADAVPPIDSHRDHFGYRDRITYPVIEGTGGEPTPGSLGPIKAGEFILGYADEEGALTLPQPEVLSRNGSFMAYRRMQEHVGAFRQFLRQNGKTPEEQELVAAKLMGRWRSGAPLVLAPERDDAALGGDPQRNNNFNYGRMDPQGYAVPLGAHIRRMNPRDTAVNMQRRQIIRRGATYGPYLPEGVPDDGADRGVVALLICASLVRQFEFIQNVWINNANFHELGNEHDPIVGYQDGSFDFTIPKRPIRRKITGLPSFTTVKGGAYFFLPGIRALRYLAALGNGP
jgi:Dyp-type peroxidase family